MTCVHHPNTEQRESMAGQDDRSHGLPNLRVGLSHSAQEPILERPEAEGDGSLHHQASTSSTDQSPRHQQLSGLGRRRSAQLINRYDTGPLPPISTARLSSDTQPSTAQHINLMTLMEQEKARSQLGHTPGTTEESPAFAWNTSMPRTSVFDPRGSKRERLSVRGKALEEHFKHMRTTPTFAFSGMKLSERVHGALKQFDVDGDDELDMQEVTALIEHVLREEQQNVHLRKAVIGLTLFTLIMLAAFFGLTWLVVISTKDTKINGEVLVTRDGRQVLTGNADYQLTGTGVLVARNLSDPSQNPTAQSAAQNSVTSIQLGGSSVIRTAQYTGTRTPFTSLISTTALMELNYLVIKGWGSAEVLLKVQGVARIPQWDSYWGTIVVILTSAGTITLDNEVITFDDGLTPVFSRLNLTSEASGPGTRRLLQQSGAGESQQPIHGLFNHVDGDSFYMDYTVADRQGVVDKASAAAKAVKVANLDTASQQGDAGSEANLLAAWSQWKRSFARGSSSQEDDMQRFLQWKDNVRTMVNINTNQGIDYWAAANQLFDRSLEDLQSTILADNAEFAKQIDLSESLDGNTPSMRRLLQANTANLPSRVDWRAQNKMTPVRDQQGCGNCWVYSSVAAVEWAYLMTQPNVDPATLDLSEAHVTFCTLTTPGYDNSKGCGGGAPPTAIKYMANIGVTTEAAYPMPKISLTKGLNGPCRINSLPAAAPMVKLSRSYGLATRNSEAAMMQALVKGPVVVYFQVWSDFWYMGGGIYNGNCPNSSIQLNHAMVVVGYDLPGRYWIVRNSWGLNWAEQGYVRVAMTGDGPGKCGILMIPILVSPGFSVTLGDFPNARFGNMTSNVNSTQGPPPASQSPPLSQAQGSPPPTQEPQGSPPPTSQSQGNPTPSPTKQSSTNQTNPMPAASSSVPPA